MNEERFYSDSEKLKIRRLIRIGKSRHAGKGAFARTEMRKGLLLGAMKGPAVAEDGKHVLWRYTTAQKWELIEVKSDLKYINHSRTPNVELIFKNGHMQVRALRDIARGEELFFTYETEGNTHFRLVTVKPRMLGSRSRHVWEHSKKA